MKVYICLAVFAFIVPDVSGVSVMEGDSVTLNTDYTVTAKDRIRWYFNDTRIAQITGDLSKTCTDVQCNEGTERFRNRLKLDKQTGSLTITNTRTTDSGRYRLQITSNSDKIFSVTVTGAFDGTDEESVSVMEGDSVTLNTDVKTNQQEKIRWYFDDTRIAQTNGYLSYTCTDVQCNEGTERFIDRLKLDHQTGSLTITDTRTTDSGVYEVLINSDVKIFRLSIQGVPAAQSDEMKRKSVKEGESVTLDSGVTKKRNDVMTWYFKDILISVTGGQSEICTDDQCKKRFKDRLKVNNQTGSLTITNTRTTDSGDYKLKITSRRFSIISERSFSVSVIAVSDSGLSSGAVAGIILAVLLPLVAAAAAAGIYYWRFRTRPDEDIGQQTSPDPCGTPLVLDAVNGNDLLNSSPTAVETNI